MAPARLLVQWQHVDIISRNQLAIDIFKEGMKSLLRHCLDTYIFYPNNATMRGQCHYSKPAMLGWCWCNLVIFRCYRLNVAVIGWYHVTWYQQYTELWLVQRYHKSNAGLWLVQSCHCWDLSSTSATSVQVLTPRLAQQTENTDHKHGIHWTRTLPSSLQWIQPFIFYKNRYLDVLLQLFSMFMFLRTSDFEMSR